ncbi:hypothetical protein K443DRAFT_646717 [Laccaria amethystina LaAM-08-1]|uniref:Uncharacterized protein n=1 Tax=Laccaria amethystina LaAM-08-1 TaxID=1095629 RepID=A0A0C9WQ74_9AGAR|nr:hypothetical protein K443DRAFT_646717 [Laccaria amethystina LaAM-08-1]
MTNQKLAELEVGVFRFHQNVDIPQPNLVVRANRKANDPASPTSYQSSSPTARSSTPSSRMSTRGSKPSKR